MYPSLSRKSRVKINEWLTWYNYHSGEGVDKMPLEQKVKWLLRANQGAYEMFSLLARELNGEMRGVAGLTGFEETGGGVLIPKPRW